MVFYYYYFCYYHYFVLFIDFFYSHNILIPLLIIDIANLTRSVKVIVRPVVSRPRPRSVVPLFEGNHPVELLAANVPTSHRVPDVSCKLLRILGQIVRRNLVQRVVRVWLQKEMQYSGKHKLQRERRLPVVPQNVQTHMALNVNVRVIDLLQTLELRRRIGETLRNAALKVKTSASVVSAVGHNAEPNVHRVASVVRNRHRWNVLVLLQVFLGPQKRNTWSIAVLTASRRSIAASTTTTTSCCCRCRLGLLQLL